ncbi:Competence protein [Lysinibacillus sphaericus]|nr:Competence protein [Lysinibacillus sphaericus]
MKGVFYILTANLNDGTPVVLDDTVKREHLRTWRTEQQFRCPQCGDRVLLKVGSIRIPHFAHEVDSTCTGSFSEGESIPHLQGKQLLHSFFQRLEKTSVLEPLISEIEQRPDLLVQHEGNAIPIEFQCSRLPEDVKSSRTEGYRSLGMEPIWILQTPEKYKERPEGMGLFSFSAFHQMFFTTSVSPEHTLLTLSPETKQFHYFSHLLPIDGNRFIAIHRKLPAHLQTFPFARPKLPDQHLLLHYYKSYKIHRTTYLQRSIFLNRRGVQDPFLRHCYELKLRPAELPLWIGVPVKGNRAFSVHDCEWQLGLIYLLRRFELSPTRVPIQRLHRFVHAYTGRSTQQIEACMDYLQFLQRIDWEKKESILNARIEKEIVHILLERFLAMQIEN